MMFITYHDLKVNTDQIAYPNRVGGGQFLTLKSDPILVVYIIVISKLRMAKWLTFYFNGDGW